MKTTTNLRFFNSLADEADFQHSESAKLTPIERLQHMRLLIDMAYSIPDGKLPIAPQQHSLIRIQHEYFK